MKGSVGKDLLKISNPAGCRGDIHLIAVFFLFIVLGLLGWMLWKDESHEIRRLSAKTEDAWGSSRVRLKQRNAILRLTVRMLSRKPHTNSALFLEIRKGLQAIEKNSSEELPSEALIFAERDMQRHVAELLRTMNAADKPDLRFEKLADLLAGAQNRLALLRIQYDRAAKRLQAQMETLPGTVLCWLLQVRRPALWGT